MARADAPHLLAHLAGDEAHGGEPPGLAVPRERRPQPDVERGARLSFRYKIDADPVDAYALLRLLDAEGEVLRTYGENFEGQRSEWTPVQWWIPGELQDTALQVEFHLVSRGGGGFWMIDDVVID